MFSNNKKQISIIGSGMAGLAAGALLTSKGYTVKIFEQNYLPGGCSSSYWRKGFVFEAGATTLVGFDTNQPLAFLAKETGIEIPRLTLELPMQVHLLDGTTISRYQDSGEWLTEAERCFGTKGQAAFWKFCKKVSDFVWRTSTAQRFFPPERPSDLIEALKAVKWDQPVYASLSLMSTMQLLNWFGLDTNKSFVAFVNQQLIITAQNTANEVNALFGAAALCYTNYENNYVMGGLINLVQPYCDYITQKGGEVLLRHAIEKIEDRAEGGHIIHTKKQGSFETDVVVFAIPANNVVDIYEPAKPHLQLMEGEQLASAFQMGIGFKPHRNYESLHHQVHLESPLVGVGAKSTFLSLSHASDTSRSDEPGLMVASVSAHFHNPHLAPQHPDKQPAIDQALAALQKADLLLPENIKYLHCSFAKEWEQWTARKWGFVGGYPQFMQIKPWQMNGHRLPAVKGKTTAYICGDTTYPGQGIPGAALSGIIAAEKIAADWK